MKPMIRSILAILLAAGMLCTAPAPTARAQTQQSQQTQQQIEPAGKSQRQSVPVQLQSSQTKMDVTSSQVMEIQQKLGLSATAANGQWDSATTAALRDFQTRNHLQPTGVLNEETLSKLGVQLHPATTSSQGPNSRY
jgi:peptidoglycan hydrolase-like protein with peptidoglycan-binding domain